AADPASAPAAGPRWTRESPAAARWQPAPARGARRARAFLAGAEGRAWARRSPGSLDGIGLAEGLAAPLDLDLDPAGIAELLVDLQRLVRAVHLVAVDPPDHVAVLDADLGVERIRHDGEELEAVGHPVLEGRDDARLGGQVGEVGERVVDLGLGDHVLVLGELLDARV